MATLNDRTRGLIKLLSLLILVVGGLLLLRASPIGGWFSREGVVRGVAVLRGSPLAPALFVPLYAGAVALAIPGTIPTLMGGAVFGLWWGTLYNWLGALLGANLAYALARFLGRDGIIQILGSKAKGIPYLERLQQVVHAHGFRGMLALRLIPAVPFNALNFGGGLVGMSWPAYGLATAVGIIPGTFVYTMFADALLEGSTEASRDAFVRMAVSGLLLLVLSFLPSILKKLKVKLPGGTGMEPPRSQGARSP